MSTLPPFREPDDFAPFDARLRQLYDAAGEEAAAPPPPAAAWAGVETRLHTRGTWWGRTVLAGLAGFVVGVLLMLLGRWAGVPVLSGEGADRANILATNAARQSVGYSAMLTALSEDALLALRSANALASSADGAAGTPRDSRQSATVKSTSRDEASALPSPGGMIPPYSAAPASPATSTTSPNSSGSSGSTTPSSPTTYTASPVSPPTADPSVAGPVKAPGGSVGSVTIGGIVPTINFGLDSIRNSRWPAYMAHLTRAVAVVENLPGPADTTVATRAARREALLDERAALLALTQRTDSLLLSLGGVVAVAAASAPPSPADSGTIRLPHTRWSVLLAGAPEWSFLGLQAPGADSVAALRRTHEQGRGGWNAALLAEYRLAPRWSIAAGAGLSTTGAELRFTDRRTVVGVRYDTTTTTSIRTDTLTVNAYLVDSVLVPHITPIFNLSGQVVGYDTVFAPGADTTWTRYTSMLQSSQTQQTVTPLLSRHEEVTRRILRPTYRFLTVPLLVRYRLGRAQDWSPLTPGVPRWSADVAVGAQMQFFLGGSHLVTADGGRTFRTERVGARETAFRPLNVALTGQVAINYALTPRLSASVAPTVRHQVASVFRAGTGLTQKPTATGLQLGVRYSF